LAEKNPSNMEGAEPVASQHSWLDVWCLGTKGAGYHKEGLLDT